MKIEWNKVPDWLNYVTCDNRDRCYGWSHRPEALSTTWESFYCEEEDGYFCKLPLEVAQGESGEKLTIEKRPNN